MTQDELKELYIKVRDGMGIFTDAQDDQIFPAFTSTVQYALLGGVPEKALMSSFCVGVLAKGTHDMWLTDTYSPIFDRMIGQLASGWSDEHAEA